MRVADFRQPEAYVDEIAIPVPPFLGRLSWCPREDLSQVGFGFSQVFYKLRATGEVGRFPADDEYAIVDVRELGELYEWIVLKVRIFDFRFTLQPFGQEAPEFSVPLKEESYLVASRDFVVDENDPAPGVLGEYGMGYAFIKSPSTGLLAYGPGDFDAAIELINFRVLESGEVCAEMVFVAGRPERITNIYLDPIGWTLRVANVFSLGVAAPVLDPLRSVVARLPLRLGPFDPVYGWVAVANALTGGQASRQWCISREQLEKDFLVRHYMQHYQTMVGSLLTWRQVPDWLDEARLPEWVVKGTSS
jgi:hypothetical protein